MSLHALKRAYVIVHAHVSVCVADRRGGLRLWPDQTELAVQSREQRSEGDAQP